ncbi:MAG: PhnE/PtxC family ABC transporter permease [Mycolicibacterium sp.]|uniref:PhnE/PtxC family ABC transporter permease n=1 Tax=Mycolicibacterium sp. TaxID=2320850 RepID=UPI003D0C1D80
MTILTPTDVDARSPITAPRKTFRAVTARRVVGMALIAVPVCWAWLRATGDGDIVNRGGLALLDDLLASALHPSLAPDFLAVVADAALVTLAFAALGTAGALVIGVLGGLVLSDAVWSRSPSAPLRLVRMALRGVLIVLRSIHELIWALLLVSVLGLDPLAAVLAIAVPFGAQTAKVFAEVLDGVPSGPLLALRFAGSRPAASWAYGLLPQAAPLLLSYSFYRFECAIRSAVILGVVGVGGLGQEFMVSLQSRNWDEVWTLVGAVVVLSAVADLWSTRLRGDLAIVTCSDWSGGHTGGSPARSSWARWSAVIAVPGLVLAWFASGVSLSGLTSERTRDLTFRLLDDMWPPALPPGGWAALAGAVLDTVAMALLAMAIAVIVTMLIGPWASRLPRGPMDEQSRPLRGAVRTAAWWISRFVLLVLRSVPPTVWAVISLFILFPGILPGALALGLYTGGILGRLVAEAWEAIDIRPRDALRAIGTPRWLAGLTATAPASGHQLVSYTLYRFEICVRDTAIVGVVGAAGLGRLLAEDLAAFRFPAVTTLLAAFVAVTIASEIVSRRLRRALRS